MKYMKKTIAALIAAAVTIISAASVTAEPQTPAPAADTPQTGQVQMADPDLTPPDTSHAEAALLMDMNSGRLIYGKNIDERLYPASTTKMMTAILALESDKMGDTVTATIEALESINPLEDSHMGILVGEELTMTDLVYGTMVPSANDAANVIAVHIGGSIDGFVQMMNTKARELGMTGTNFANPCGVHNDNHYTTARDLATLANYCMNNDQFREIAKTPTYHIDPTAKYTEPRDLLSTNLFLGMGRSSYHYNRNFNCTGIKTGTTEAAGHCLVSSAGYEDMNLLAVVLKCDDENVTDKAYSYTISKALFDFGFNNYHSVTINPPGKIVGSSKVDEAKDDKRLSFTTDTAVSALIPASIENIDSEVQAVTELDTAMKAPITKGTRIGTVTFKYREAIIGRSNLIAANDVELDKPKHIFNTAIRIIINPLILIPAMLIIVIALFANAHRKRVKRRRRLQQFRQRRAQENEGGAGERTVRNSELNRSRSKASNSR